MTTDDSGTGRGLRTRYRLPVLSGGGGLLRFLEGEDRVKFCSREIRLSLSSLISSEL